MLNRQRILFSEFLTEPAEYYKAEEFWKARWRELIHGTEEENEWQVPWIRNMFVDGTPCRDGNPIFSTLSSRRRLGIRLIQTLDAEEFFFWTDTFADEQTEVKELVISCALTPISVYDCLDIMRQWVDTESVRLAITDTYPVSTGEAITTKPRHSFPSDTTQARLRQLDVAA